MPVMRVPPVLAPGGSIRVSTQGVDDINERFLAWAGDKARTLEERYGIQRLVDWVYDFCYSGPDKIQKDWQADLLKQEQRRFNPGYIPEIDPGRLNKIAPLLEKLTKLELNSAGDDRPIRNLDFLEFVPAFEILNLKDVEIDRLTALRFLPRLRDFHIRTDGVEDYRDLVSCRELRKIAIQTWHPCPVLTGLDDLPHLETFDWLGNARLLADLHVLPAVKKFRVDWAEHHPNLVDCVRDLHALPEMPELEYFWGGSFYRLDGIERYPKLRILCIKGWYKSLAPLTALKHVTHLRVASPRLAEIESAGQMPSLFQFAVRSARPQDWSGLFETATFREVYQFDCEGPQPDLGTLRMLLPPREEFFGAPARRKLAPLRLRVRPEKDEHGAYQDECPESTTFPDGPGGWDGCPAMRQSERWFAEELCRKALRKAGLLALQGIRMDREIPDSYHVFTSEPSPHSQRTLSISLKRTEAIGRLRDVVECLRRALSRLRYRWQVSIMAQAEVDAEDWDDSWSRGRTTEQRIQEMIEEELEAERSRKRYRQFLQDEHRLRLLKELGNEPAPGEFKPTPLPPEETLPRISVTPPAGKDEDKKPGNEYADGGLADPDSDDEAQDESWLGPVEISDPNEKWHDLFFMVTVTEEAVWAHPRHALDAISYLLDLKPEYPPGKGPEDYERD